MKQPSGHAGPEDEKFRLIFEAVSDGIFVFDSASGALTEVNAAGCAMFGYAHEELVGRRIEPLSAGTPPYTASALHEQFAAGAQADQLLEWRFRAQDGRLFWGEMSLRRVNFAGRPVGLAIIRDITERKRRLDELAEQARLDELTHLPNRRDFDVTLQQEIARAERYSAPLCAAMGDIDRFKAVNDTFGHPVGDAVLVRLSGYLRRHLRRIDYVARWGGEEFAILLPETRLDVAEELLNRLRAGISRHAIPEIGRPVTLSFGVTEFCRNEPAEDLMKRVDEALYRAKQTGRNRVSRS